MRNTARTSVVISCGASEKDDTETCRLQIPPFASLPRTATPEAAPNFN